MSELFTEYFTTTKSRTKMPPKKQHSVKDQTPLKAVDNISNDSGSQR